MPKPLESPIALRLLPTNAIELAIAFVGVTVALTLLYRNTSIALQLDMRKPQHLIPIIVLWKSLWDDFRPWLRPQFDPETEDLRGRVVDSDVGIPAAIEIAEGEAEFSRVLPVEQPSPTRIAVPLSVRQT